MDDLKIEKKKYTTRLYWRYFEIEIEKICRIRNLGGLDCSLCSLERTVIFMKRREESCMNKNSEWLSRCRHQPRVNGRGIK